MAVAIVKSNATRPMTIKKTIQSHDFSARVKFAQGITPIRSNAGSRTRALFALVTFFIRFGPSVFNHVHRLSYDQVSHQEVLMHLRLAIVTFLLVFLWMSVACSTKPAEVSAAASTTSSLSSKQVTLPAGTVVTVLLGKAVSSKISTDGDHFRATVSKPVEVDGKVVVPAGAEALGRVAVPQAGFKGAAVLRLVLESVTVNRDAYDVRTSSVSRAGSAGAAYMGAGEIVLPAKSTLSFKLADPVTVKI
jgi:hypothetical protein